MASRCMGSSLGTKRRQVLAAIAGALLLSAAAVATLLLAGPSAAARAVNVSAATPLTTVLPEIARDASYSFGGSNTLQLQIERGAPADVFLSAEPKEAQALYRERPAASDR